MSGFDAAPCLHCDGKAAFVVQGAYRVPARVCAVHMRKAVADRLPVPTVFDLASQEYLTVDMEFMVRQRGRGD